MMRSSLGIVIVGILIGEVAALPLTRLVGSFQEGIEPLDALTHLTVALIWIAVAFAAGYVPAARAARVDPLTALRHE